MADRPEDVLAKWSSADLQRCNFDDLHARLYDALAAAIADKEDWRLDAGKLRAREGALIAERDAALDRERVLTKEIQSVLDKYKKA